jgi:hypothetical protein
MMEGMDAASIDPVRRAPDPDAEPPTPRPNWLEEGAAAGSRLWRIMRYSQEHTSIKLAAQAASSATVSTTWTRSPDVLKVVPMTGKTSGDSSRGVSGFIFRGIQDSFTTQGLRAKSPESWGFILVFAVFSLQKPSRPARSGLYPKKRRAPHLRVKRPLAG